MSALTERIEVAKDRKNKGAQRGIQIGLRNILQVSNSQVPHEEGDLERDGGTSIDNEALIGAVAYGRNADAARYAVDQHENLTYHHDPGRNAKFLENAINSTRSANAEIIATAIRGEIDG